jgi:predicted Zn finger-like uncharacterized protein
MALITQCPSCAAAFRVTPLDLQAHGGDVRCGRCGQIFNGYARLSTVQDPGTTAEPLASETEQRSKSASGMAEIREATDVSDRAIPEESGITLERRDDSIHEDVTGDVPHAQTTASAVTSAEPLRSEQPVIGNTHSEAPGTREPSIKDRETADITRDSPIDTSAVDTSTVDTSAVDTSTDREEPVWRTKEAAVEAQDDFADENYSPRQTAFEKAQSRSKTIAWSFGNVFLLFVLAAQATYFYRAELAFTVPAAKPYLERYCELLDCTIRLPQRTKSLNIESSDMQSDTQRPGVITLNATVRNHASYPQAFPLFQLTLIDAKDHPLASRTFLPEAYLGHKVGPSDAIAPNDEIKISLHLDSGNLNAAGFRLSLLSPGS